MRRAGHRPSIPFTSKPQHGSPGLRQKLGVGRFIHVSDIGADAGSASPYIRSRGKGERSITRGFSTGRRSSAPPSCSDEATPSSSRQRECCVVFPSSPFRTRPDAAATRLCRGRSRRDRQGDVERPVLDVLRARRAARLRLPMAARNDCPAPRQKTASGSDPVWPLAHARLRCGDATRAAHHAKSGRAHAIG